MRTKRHHLVIAGTILVLVALLAAGLWSYVRAASTRWAKIHGLQAELVRLRHQNAALTALAGQTRRQKARLQKVEQAVPTRPHVGKLLERFGLELTDAGATNPQVSTGTLQRGNTFDALPVTLGFESSYPGLWRVLRSLDRGDYLLRPMQLTITRNDQIPQSATPEQALDIKLVLATFARAAGKEKR